MKENAGEDILIVVVGAIIRGLALAGARGHEAAIAGTLGQGAGKSGTSGDRYVKNKLARLPIRVQCVGEWNRHIDRVVVVGIKKPREMNG